MTQTPDQFEMKIDTWYKIGDNDRILRTADGFRVHVYKNQKAWSARVHDQQATIFRDSKLPYISDSDAENACLRVIADMRMQRKAPGAMQGKLL